MERLIAGLVLFLGIHSVSIVAPAWRDRAATRLGGAWQGLYSLVAAAGLALIVFGYVAARSHPTVLYQPPPGLRWVAIVAMIPVFPLLFAAYLPGRLRVALKHPMLLGTKVWALSHLLVNGTLADVLLFGGVLLWAGLDRMSLKRRPPRPIRSAPASRWNDMVAIVLGLAVYGLTLRYLHALLIGVPLLR
jgi:uncharacterized membrane protein